MPPQPLYLRCRRHLYNSAYRNNRTRAVVTKILENITITLRLFFMILLSFQPRLFQFSTIQNKTNVKYIFVFIGGEGWSLTITDVHHLFDRIFHRYFVFTNEVTYSHFMYIYFSFAPHQNIQRQWFLPGENSARSYNPKPNSQYLIFSVSFPYTSTFFSPRPSYPSFSPFYEFPFPLGAKCCQLFSRRIAEVHNY